MNEQQIEDLVERMINNLDRLFLRDCINERQYQQAVDELNKWAEAKYDELYRKDNVMAGARL